MMKKLLAGFLSFTLACPAWAVSGAQAESITKYVKESKISSQSVSFKALYRQYRSQLSMDVQREFDLYLKTQPDVNLPKARVTKLQEGKNQVIQIEFVQGKDRATWRFTGKKNEVATLTLVHDGKKVERKLGKYEISHPVRFLASFGNEKPKTAKVRSVHLLTTEMVKSLPPLQKRKYVDRVRDLLVAAERAQTAFQAKKKKKSADFFWSTLAPDAYADGPSGDCIVAGWSGTYEGGSCKAPASAITSSCLRCNTDIYGAEAPCVGPATGKIALNATEQCNSLTEDKKYSVFQGVKSESELADKMSSLAGALTALREKCAAIEQSVASGVALSDQTNACTNLNARLSDLENANCAALEQLKDQFPELVCKEEPPPKEEEPPVADQPAPYPSPENPPAQDQGDCVNLPYSQNLLNCASSQVGVMKCSDGDRYFCNCSGNEECEYLNSNKPTGCLPKQTPHDELIGRVKEKKSESFIKPWMIALLGGGALLWMQHRQQQQMLEAYYQTPPAYPLGLPPISNPTFLPTTR